MLAGDRRPEAARQAAGCGARWLPEVGRLAAGADVLITVLPAPGEVRELMLGTGGAAAALRPGTTWIDMTSNSPDAVTAIRSALLDRGVQVLDAPAGGGVAAARQGSLQLLVGGQAEVVARHRELQVGHAGRVVEGDAGGRITGQQRGDLLVCARLPQPAQQGGHALRVVEGHVGRGITGQQRGGLLVCARLPQPAQQGGHDARVVEGGVGGGPVCGTGVRAQAGWAIAEVEGGAGVTGCGGVLVQLGGELVRRRIGQAAGVASVSVGGDLDQVRVNIHAARPGVVTGHGGAGADRLRAELEELTGKPVLLAIGDGEAGPPGGPRDAGSGRGT